MAAEEVFDAVVFVNCHSDLNAKEQKKIIDLEGIHQTTVCLAEPRMPCFMVDQFITDSLPKLMHNAFSKSPQETCQVAIKDLSTRLPGVKKYGFDKSKGLCSDTPTKIRNKSWEFLMADAYPKEVCKDYDGIYLMTRDQVENYKTEQKARSKALFDAKIRSGLKLGPQPIPPIPLLTYEKIFGPTEENVDSNRSVVIYKKDLLEILKQRGIKNVLIIDAGCNEVDSEDVPSDDLIAELSKPGSILGGKRTRRIRRKKRTKIIQSSKTKKK